MPVEHVTFRPGPVLAERLDESPLAPGATAKRNLWRYYALLDAEYEEWAKALNPTQEELAAITAFLNTRYWESIPETQEFWENFLSFARSPLALSRFKWRDLELAAQSLKSATRTCIIALLDRAEAMNLGPRDAATADATSAASSGP